MVAPGGLEMRQPVLYFPEGPEIRLGVARALSPARVHQSNVADPPAFLVGNKTRPFQNPEMLVDGGQGNPERPGQLADGSLPER